MRLNKLTPTQMKRKMKHMLGIHERTFKVKHIKRQSLWLKAQ
uniref:Uncharacterized protein n=1 Tax=Cucumis melo TaxID=3656 RepID=A0A9I9EC97_CUCME